MLIFKLITNVKFQHELKHEIHCTGILGYSVRVHLGVTNLGKVKISQAMHSTNTRIFAHAEPNPSEKQVLNVPEITQIKRPQNYYHPPESIRNIIKHFVSY